ncbi:MAG TPA: cytochrome C assembly protein, partial [Dehalococcoidia bacterium]|nr:cytochrome C assembly protein [Dehalococcoidia bacterium]
MILNNIYELRWKVLPPAAGVAMIGMAALALITAPTEVVEGDVQRLLYVHLPSALASYFAFSVTAVCSVLFLLKRDFKWDSAAQGAAIVGLIFTLLTLMTGSLWGKPIWGVYWQWDPRITTTLILFLIFSAYLIARKSTSLDSDKSARFCSIYAIIGFLDIPLIHMSVRWWRTLHPQPIIAKLNPALPDEMLLVTLVSVLAVILVAAWFITLGIETELLSQRLLKLKAIGKANISEK